ncbi:MAG: RDD family protein [Tenericutes bacterium]|nr:RDD family protein [Mycoplasmatota bacterium]
MANIKNKDGKVVEAVIEEKDTNTLDKPYFFPRAIAYIIDVLLVSIVCTGVLLLIPKNDTYEQYYKEYEQIQSDFISEKIDSREYLDKSKDIIYGLNSNNVISMIVEVVLIILYFIVFQFYNKGQTLGKKLMKIRVVSVKNGELSLDQVTYRALIVNSILFNILAIGAVLFAGKSYYYYAYSGIQLLSSTVFFITILMILFRKDGRGLHDVIAGTKVIQER